MSLKPSEPESLESLENISSSMQRNLSQMESGLQEESKEPPSQSLDPSITNNLLWNLEAPSFQPSESVWNLDAPKFQLTESEMKILKQAVATNIKSLSKMK